jgi:salicylate hydroxylase
VHINPRGSHALHECLPDDLWQAFVTTAGDSEEGFGFLDEQLNELIIVEDDITSGEVRDPTNAHHSVSRITLHQVLSAGLGDALHYDHEFVRYQRLADGTIRIFFTNGIVVDADVLVGADGGASRVRQQYLPHAERIDTGVLTVAGKLILDDETMSWLPTRLHAGANLMLPPKGYGMFFAPHKHLEPPADDGMVFGGNDETLDADSVLFQNTVSYVMWAFAAAPGRWPAGVTLQDLNGKELRDLIVEMIAGWHPDVRRMVADSDPATVSLLPIRSSKPIDPWPATNVTLIGDAIHSMTPMKGIGANTALRDAELLCANLVAAATGERDVIDAIADYERQMIAYGFKAVRDSLRGAQQFVSENSMSRGIFKLVLRTFDRFPTLKRKAFQNLGND